MARFIAQIFKKDESGPDGGIVTLPIYESFEDALKVLNKECEKIGYENISSVDIHEAEDYELFEDPESSEPE